MPNENLEHFYSKDPFEVLGVSSGAPNAEIHRAYRKLSSEWHPDKHAKDGRDTNEIMGKISVAYETIEKKKQKEKGKGTPPSQQESGNFQSDLRDVMRGVFDDINRK
ncbi:MAG: J domain-containing protein [Candidatus Paceibacterota bacterium]|jgi:DnaJ family protein C protein 3